MNKNQQTRKKLATISAPGKIILCGEHAVVYGEDALAMSIDLRCFATIYQNQSDIPSCCIQINIFITPDNICRYKIRYEQTIAPFMSQIGIEYHQYAQQRQNVCPDKQQIKIQYKYLTCCKYLHFQPKKHSAYEIDIRSEIPIGKCLGSSAAFNTVFAAAVIYLNEDKSDVDNLQKICSLSKQLEKVEHGFPSGLDNYVSTYGGLMLYNHKKQPNFVRIENQLISRVFDNSISMKLVDSGVEKNTKQAVAIVNQHCQSDKKYRTIIKEIGRFATKIVDLLNKCNEESTLCQFQAKQQILSTLQLNHKYLRQLGVSIPQIESIVQHETISGKNCAKITGAGMGGYVLVIGMKNNYEQGQSKQSYQSNNKYLLTKFSEKGLDFEVVSDP